MNIDPKDIDVVILCGGLGKRLRSIVNDKPKSIAEINGCPFLDLLIDYVSGYGFRRFILCTGYMSYRIEDYFKNTITDKEIIFSHESSPLGTGGAVKNAQRIIRSNSFLVMNGDSICKLDLIKFLEFHNAKNALISIALVASKNVTDFGIVNLDKAQRIIKFSEKSKSNGSNNLINAGVYIFNKEVLPLIPGDGNYSLEYDLFPKLKECYGYIADKDLIDIGTPLGYEMAKKIL